jgi:ATP-dependent RNA helicase RhlE
MLDMGFLPAIRRIVGGLPKDRQTMCFSATMAAEVVHLVKDYLRQPVRVALGSTIKPSENVRVQAFEVAHDRKQEVLQRLLARETGRCLVFARTKRGTERLAKTLIRQGFAAAMIHGDRSQSQRTAALAGFQHGRYRILVATDVASRGIHVQDIAHVINYDMPADAESFIHRAGRTGRAGEHGVASTLFARDQHSDLLQLERTLGIRMERMREGTDSWEKADGTSARTPASPRHRSEGFSAIGGLDRTESAPRPRLERLPGEVFQFQMEG